MMATIHSFLLSRAFTPDTFARSIDAKPDEAMTAAAADFDTHISADVVVGTLSVFSFGIAAGIYGVISYFKSLLKSEAFAQLAPLAATTQPEVISEEEGKYKVSFFKPPYGYVEIKDLDEKYLSVSGNEEDESGSYATTKAISITIDGITTIKRGINVHEMQARLREDAFKHRSVYEQLLGAGDLGDLYIAITGHKADVGETLAKTSLTLQENMAPLRLEVVLQPRRPAAEKGGEEIRFWKDPYGQVEIRDLNITEKRQRALRASEKAMLISIGGVKTIKQGMSVAELQKVLFEHIFKNKDNYKQGGASDIGLTRAHSLHAMRKIKEGEKLWRIKADDKKLILENCLRRINNRDADENDLEIFNYIFNLKLPDLNTIPNLSNKDIEHLVKMAGKVASWNANDAKHCFNMLTEDLSDDLLAIYRLIFAKPLYDKAVLLKLHNPVDCLRKIGTKEFNTAHLDHFAAFFGVDTNNLSVESFNNLPKLTHDEVAFVMSMVVHPDHLNIWDKNNINHLHSIVQSGLSDSLLELYKLIFDTSISDRLVMVKTEALADCLGKIGTDQFAEDDRKKLQAIFSLDSSDVSSFQELSALNKDEIDFIVSMVAHSVHANGWDRCTTDHLLGMVQVGLSDGLFGVYKLIFEYEILKKSVALAEAIQSKEIKFLDTTVQLTLQDGTSAILTTHGHSTDKDRYVEITINDKTEKLHGWEIGQLKEKIVSNKTSNENYDAVLPSTPEIFNQKLLDRVNGLLSQMIRDSNSKDHTHINTHTQQIKIDWKRTAYNRLVQIESSSSTMISQPAPVSKLITEEGKRKNDFQCDDRTLNTIYLFVNQMVAGNFNGVVPEQVKLLTTASAHETPTKNSKDQQFTFTIPHDFDTSRKVLLKSSTPVGLDFYDWEGEFVFKTDFFQQLADRAFLETTDLGIESAVFTKIEKKAVKSHPENSLLAALQT